MEKFFEEGTLTQEELATGLRTATMSGKLLPMVCASGVSVVNIDNGFGAACIASSINHL